MFFAVAPVEDELFLTLDGGKGLGLSDITALFLEEV